MDLKLKDEVTKLLIANPGVSISEIARRTRNYYSYTHKLLFRMERDGLIRTLSKDVEVKAAVAIMYLSIIFLLVIPLEPQVFAAPRPGITPSVEFNWVWIILIIVPVLLVIHYLRKKS